MGLTGTSSCASRSPTPSWWPPAPAWRPCAASPSGCSPRTAPTAVTARISGSIYGTRHESELYYREEFEALARRKPNFHYLATLSRAPESWTGLCGYVQDHMARIIEERAARLGQPLPAPPPDPAIPPAELKFDIYTYICGLNNMVAGVRERLAGFGWHRKQIVFERYD